MTDDTRTTDPTAKPAEEVGRSLRPEERVLLLDMWQRSGLTARDFGALVGVSKHTLFVWKKKFDRSGPAGLSDAPRGAPPGTGPGGARVRPTNGEAFVIARRRGAPGSGPRSEDAC